METSCMQPPNYYDHIIWLSRDQQSGSLFFKGKIRNGYMGAKGFENPIALAISQDGKNVYVTSGTRPQSSIAWFSRNASNGALSYGGAIYKDTLMGTKGFTFVDAVAIAEDGTSVYTVSSEDSSIAIFARDLISGGLRYKGYLRQNGGTTKGLAMVQDLCLSPQGNHVYVASYLEGAVAWFNRNTSTDLLQFAGIYSYNYYDIDELRPGQNVLITRNGNYVIQVGAYVMNPNGYAIGKYASFFARDNSTGNLTYLKSFPFGGDCPVLSPDDRFLYVQRYDTVVAWYEIIYNNTSALNSGIQKIPSKSTVLQKTEIFDVLGRRIGTSENRGFLHPGLKVPLGLYIIKSKNSCQLRVSTGQQCIY